MEKVGFERAMETVREKHSKEVSEIVTDQHPAIKSLLSKNLVLMLIENWYNANYRSWCSMPDTFTNMTINNYKCSHYNIHF